MTGRNGRRHRSPSSGWAYVAAGWSALFATVHVFWAVGESAGLASSAGRELAAERPAWFVVGGLWGVAGLLLLAAALAVALARSPAHGWRRRALPLLGAAAGVLLLARGAGLQVLLLSGAYDGNHAVTPEQRFWSIALWNPWFVIGGSAFLLAARARAGAPPTT